MQRYTIIKHGYIHVIVLNKAKKKLYEYKHKLQRKPKKPSKLQQCKNFRNLLDRWGKFHLFTYTGNQMQYITFYSGVKFSVKLFTNWVYLYLQYMYSNNIVESQKIMVCQIV